MAWDTQYIFRFNLPAFLRILPADLTFPGLIFRFFVGSLHADDADARECDENHETRPDRLTARKR